MYEIDRDFPPPPGSAGPAKGGRPRLFPFGEMKPGESILVGEDSFARARAAVTNWKRRHPQWDYRTRKMPDGTLRIWRTA
jgi:hypothetical protein